MEPPAISRIAELHIRPDYWSIFRFHQIMPQIVHRENEFSAIAQMVFVDHIKEHPGGSHETVKSLEQSGY